MLFVDRFINFNQSKKKRRRWDIVGDTTEEQQIPSSTTSAEDVNNHITNTLSGNELLANLVSRKMKCVCCRSNYVIDW